MEKEVDEIINQYVNDIVSNLMLLSAKARQKVLVKFCYTCGMRIGETISICECTLDNGNNI